VVAVATAAVIVVVQLFVQPIVGLADNHDYERIMGYAGFQHSTTVETERYFDFFRSQYLIVAPGYFKGGYHSSETILLFIARYLHLAFSKQALFDIRELAAIHTILFLIALAGLIRACRDFSVLTQAVVAALLVFVFTDVAYVSAFNSFFSQTASLLFLLLTAAVAALAIRKGTLSGFPLLVFFGCAALFVCSKPQERLAGPLLAIFGARLAGVRLAGAWRSAAAWLAVGLCAFAVVYGRHTPNTLKQASVYQVVFADLLAHSEDPAADAAELGLDPAWIRYVGINSFATNSPLLDPGFSASFAERVNYRKILGFYFRHPKRLAGRLQRASRNLWSLRPRYGNFEKSAEHPVLTRATRFSLWSRTRLLLGAHPILWVLLLFGGNVTAVSATYRRASPRGRLFREGLILMVVMSSLAFLVCSLAQAPPDISRSLFTSHALRDLLLIADVGWITEAAVLRVR